MLTELTFAPLGVMVNGEKIPLEPWQIEMIRNNHDEMYRDGNWPSPAKAAEFSKFLDMHIRLDGTWRIYRRYVPEYFHEDGQDCYVFIKKGGERPTDKYTVMTTTVSSFWGREEQR